MGTWGASLYDDDDAIDLKTTIGVMCKVPATGDGLLAFLMEMYGSRSPMDPEGALFWLVTADQFERRGIQCEEAAATALSVIEAGTELAHARERGADAAFLKRRSAVLQELAQRLKSPRAPRAVRKPGKAPDMVLQAGEIHAFRTMKGRAWHPYRLESDGPFEPDGWGAMVVLATGRAFGWLPWCALASLTVDSDRRPSLVEAKRGRLILHAETDGAGRFVPKRAHARGLGLELLGQVALDPDLVNPHLSTWSIARAIQYDWTIAYAAFSATSGGAELGCELSSLVEGPVEDEREP